MIDIDCMGTELSESAWISESFILVIWIYISFVIINVSLEFLLFFRVFPCDHQNNAEESEHIDLTEQKMYHYH